jgi:hypothetical protein
MAFLRFSTVALLLAVSPFLWAADASFTGTFINDTDLEYFTFSLANPTEGVTLRTWSYAGGTNDAGQVISSGGFEPYLNIYFGNGTQMNPGLSGPCHAPTGHALADLQADPITGECADVYYPTTISFPGGVWDAGTYTVVLSIFANPGVGDLSAGFFGPAILGSDAPGNFTCHADGSGYQGNPPTVPVDGPFCDGFDAGVERDGHWALDILNVDRATEVSVPGVPEPGSLSLALLGGLFFMAGRTRLRR